MRHRRTIPTFDASSGRAARTLDEMELIVVVTMWNASSPIGSRVLYRSHPAADPLETVTTSPAFLLSDHTPCVMVSAVRGAVALSALTVAEPREATA